jgi:hypothetical protein
MEIFFQVGTGKVFTSEFLNRVYDKDNQSDGYPQGTAKSYFVEGVGKLKSTLFLQKWRYQKEKSKGRRTKEPRTKKQEKLLSRKKTLVLTAKMVNGIQTRKRKPRRKQCGYSERSLKS